MDQPQKHVDSGGVRPSPIRPRGPRSSPAVLLKKLKFVLQVQADVGWLHGFHRGTPLIEMGEEPLGYGDSSPG
jgi:hypothetical protein